MTEGECAEMRLLVQADVDGELSPAEAARIAAHVDGCKACAALQVDLMGLSARLRQDVPSIHAPASLRAAIEERIPAPQPRRLPRPKSWAPAWGFSGGFAIAACLALLMMPRLDGLAGAVVAGHIRALQPGHLMDVVSTDQHTVKPWFDGRLDYAPPVKELAAQGFPLEGGRLDVLGTRPVAVLVYGRLKHEIDLYVVPGAQEPASEGTINGYSYVRWSEGGMNFWAVSDVAAADLDMFVRLWRAQ